MLGQFLFLNDVSQTSLLLFVEYSVDVLIENDLDVRVDLSVLEVLLHLLAKIDENSFISFPIRGMQFSDSLIIFWHSSNCLLGDCRSFKHSMLASYHASAKDGHTRLPNGK
jgi:hypothetical protein